MFRSDPESFRPCFAPVSSLLAPTGREMYCLHALKKMTDRCSRADCGRIALAIKNKLSHPRYRVNTDTFFVSHNGGDLDNCGNQTMPCRTVRHAVKMISDGGQIYVDYAQGKPLLGMRKDGAVNILNPVCKISFILWYEWKS